MTGTAKATVLKLLVEVGAFCSIYQSEVLQKLPCRRIEADEIWAFVGAKQKNAKRAGDGIPPGTLACVCAITDMLCPVP